ncbi:hypothetical protein TcasGA2_TC012897 [Tribolium castaneum]|uniref:Uncharacterized protein n=1 Tax=Tribolium castaneum TaxID=7070 RepID=D7EJ11_TRICA|nr:PREDICTED: uncharacterized protein LOC103314834 [Tribolium castaneum]EFA12497.1 hypothetical protein TcasGA2_TC012897 [Tribolium castaneum]|eukprot:XP_008200090.1 PREDICTED: uncharacterized protein LOC103314834 [Tribolium castaneum]
MCLECRYKRARDQGYKPFLPRGFGKREKNPDIIFTNLGINMGQNFFTMKEKIGEFEGDIRIAKDIGIIINPSLHASSTFFRTCIKLDEIEECQQPQFDIVTISVQASLSVQIRFGSAKSKARFLKELQKAREYFEQKKETKGKKKPEEGIKMDEDDDKTNDPVINNLEKKPVEVQAVYLEKDIEISNQQNNSGQVAELTSSLESDKQNNNPEKIP